MNLTNTHFLGLTRELEGEWEFDEPVKMCFFDLEKAYDVSLKVTCGGCFRSMGNMTF